MTQTNVCYSTRVEEITVGDEILNDTRWYQIEIGQKFKNHKLGNVVKICINKSAFSSFFDIPSAFVLTSITSDEIWFLKVRVKRVSSKQWKDYKKIIEKLFY
jgi:hypothetical protein